MSPATSRFATPSPVSLPSPMSSNINHRHLPQSSLSGDGARSVPLLEHIRRLRSASAGSIQQPTTNNFTTDHGTCSAAPRSAVPPLTNVGLKDLLLSNDDDDIMTATVKSESSPTECSGGTTHDSGGSVGDNHLFDRGKIFMSETGADRPDSSTTKQSKQAVLLMRLLSRPDDDDADDDDVTASNNDTSTNMTSVSPPTTDTPQSADRLDSVFDNHTPGVQAQADEQPARSNNLLRVLHSTCFLYFFRCEF